MIHGLMSSSGSYSILGILRTGGWEKGPHTLPWGILERERLAQPGAPRMGGGSRMWHGHLQASWAGPASLSDWLKAQVPDLWLLPSFHRGLLSVPVASEPVG